MKSKDSCDTAHSSNSIEKFIRLSRIHFSHSFHRSETYYKQIKYQALFFIKRRFRKKRTMLPTTRRAENTIPRTYPMVCKRWGFINTSRYSSRFSGVSSRPWISSQYFPGSGIWKLFRSIRTFDIPDSWEWTQIVVQQWDGHPPFQQEIQFGEAASKSWPFSKQNYLLGLWEFHDLTFE